MILEMDFNITPRRLVMQCKDCLSEEAKSRPKIGLAALLHTVVGALSVHSVVICRTKNTQSAAAAQEHFEKQYLV